MTTTYLRKDRTVNGTRRHGPTHITPAGGLSLCGRRLRGFIVAAVNRPDESVLCPACLAHERAGTRKPWKR